MEGAWRGSATPDTPQRGPVHQRRSSCSPFNTLPARLLRRNCFEVVRMPGLLSEEELVVAEYGLLRSRTIPLFSTAMVTVHQCRCRRCPCVQLWDAIGQGEKTTRNTQQETPKKLIAAQGHTSPITTPPPPPQWSGPALGAAHPSSELGSLSKGRCWGECTQLPSLRSGSVQGRSISFTTSNFHPQKCIPCPSRHHAQGAHSVPHQGHLRRPRQRERCRDVRVRCRGCKVGE